MFDLTLAAVKLVWSESVSHAHHDSLRAWSCDIHEKSHDSRETSSHCTDGQGRIMTQRCPGHGLIKGPPQLKTCISMAQAPVIQCCQFSYFVAKSSNFSNYPSNIFFQKHLTTNLAIFKMYLATFSNYWEVTQKIKKVHIFPSKSHKKRKPKTPCSRLRTSRVLSFLIFAIVQFNNNNLIVHLWYTLLVACTCNCWSVSTLNGKGIVIFQDISIFHYWL